MWGWRDRIIGIIVGVVLGVGVILAFVFLLSEQTVDAPSLSGKQSPAATSSPSGDVNGGARGSGGR